MTQTNAIFQCSYVYMVILIIYLYMYKGFIFRIFIFFQKTAYCVKYGFLRCISENEF
jgi:ABC-type multidrug transport system permease subunit